jgi:hypothetical protein
VFIEPWRSLVARLLGVQEVVGSNPAGSTVLINKPFGEYVEGLSYCGAKSCAFERAVQQHDFEYSTLGSVIGGNPLLFQGL